MKKDDDYEIQNQGEKNNSIYNIGYGIDPRSIGGGKKYLFQ